MFNKLEQFIFKLEKLENVYLFVNYFLMRLCDSSRNILIQKSILYSLLSNHFKAIIFPGFQNLYPVTQ